MKFRRIFIASLLLLSAAAIPAFSAGLTYTCDPSLSAIACTGLGAIQTMYDTTFSNVDATVYVTMGNASLGSNRFCLDPVTYTAYLAALSATRSGDTVDTEAFASLPSTEPAVYNGGNVELTAALAAALGISALYGETASGGICFGPGSATCYDGIITISNAVPLYYRNGTQDSGAYDFFSVVQHETDEILGIGSCIVVGGSGNLSDSCSGSNLSSADLFRYYNAGSRVFQSTSAGAYFSFDGGATNGAQGAVYNTSVPFEDYGNFYAASPCSVHQFVQDGVGCPGVSTNITGDGLNGGAGPEITILDAIGYNQTAISGYNQTTTPEPTTFGLLALALLAGTGVRGSRAALARRRKLPQ